MAKNLKLHCCPMCGSKALKLYESDEDPADLDGEPKLLMPGEVVGVVFSEEKTGCYDWQHTVVGVVCDKDHVFWVDATQQPA